MSDPLWFLENLEENGSKSHLKDVSLNYAPEQNSGQREWTSEASKNSLGGNSVKHTTQSQNNLETNNLGENKATTSKILDLLKDEESLKAAIQNSLLESIKNGQPPEIKITLNSSPDSTLSNVKIEENNNVVEPNFQNENSNTYINFNQNDNAQDFSEEKSFDNENSKSQATDANETTGNNNESKVYVILPPEQNSQFNTEPLLKGDSSSRYFKEVGSTVINLNDLISSKANSVLNNGEITANIDLSSVIGSAEGIPKVELVIKVKDEREKTDKTTTYEKSPKSEPDAETARLEELLQSSASLDSLNGQLRGGRDVRNIPIKVTPAASQTPLDDWVDKTTDSYTRRDGAQCTRTVWTTPQGRRVETKCYKEERNLPRGRRVRDLDWSPRLGSIWSDINDDIDRLFSFF